MDRRLREPSTLLEVLCLDFLTSLNGELRKDPSRIPKQKSRIADAIQFRFSTNFFPHYTIRHFTRSTDTVERRAARHAFRKIIEYNSTSEEGFNANGTKLSTYPLWMQSWSIMARNNNNATGVEVVEVCSHTLDKVFELCVMFTGTQAALTVNGSKFMVDNNAIEHTLSIKNYPFVSSSSRLALKTHLSVVDRVKDFNDSSVVDTSTESAVDLSATSDEGSNIHPVASWSDTCEACGTTAPVVKSVIFDAEPTKDIDVNFPNGETDEITITLIDKFVYFSFLTDCPKPEIYWDPALGIVDDSGASAGFSLIPSFWLSLVVLIANAIAFTL